MALTDLVYLALAFLPSVILWELLRARGARRVFPFADRRNQGEQ